MQFDRKRASISLDDFLRSNAGKELAGPTGGIQGSGGTLFGVPYAAGSWQDKLIEAFAGPHDYVGGAASGFYDEQGNATRGLTGLERAANTAWSAAAIPITAPMATASAIPLPVGQAISIILRNAK